MKLYHRIIGDGEPLIILHGLFGFSDNWQTLGKRFAEKNQVVLVDLTNHGQSPWSDQFDYSSMARDLNELITDLNLKSPSILGHSMGGKVTMEYAVTFGQLSKMIIADIGPKFYPPHHNTIIEGLQAIDLKSLKSRGEADKLLGQYVSNMGERQFLLKNLKRTQDGFAWKMNLNMISENIKNVGQEIVFSEKPSVPTLFLRGGNSNYILDEDIAVIENLFNEAVVKTIPKAGHWLHAEQPEVFYELVDNFLTK